MTPHDVIEQVLGTWRLNDKIGLKLLQAIPAKGLGAIPTGSKGRNVAQVFAHIHHVRFAWLRYNAPSLVSGMTRFEKGASPSKSELQKALRASGQAVEGLLRRALSGEAAIKSFKRQPIRWLGYLISHDSHHRGQIALALKQSGMRLPPEIAIRGLWQEWYWGKE